MRRQEDQGRIFFVDQYSPVLFITIAGILFLCAVDAILTLHLLSRGAIEANPLMSYLLNLGPYAFFISKYTITIISIFCLFILRNVPIRVLNLSAQSVLYVFAWIYLVVVAWELYLMFLII